MDWKTADIIPLRSFADARGMLTCVESDGDIPFTIRRIYWIYAVPQNETRGGHCHINECKILVAMHGHMLVHVNDGVKEQTFLLERPDEGLYVPAGVWLYIDSFSPDGICMVLSSEHYSTDDYERDFNRFIGTRGRYLA